MITFTTRPGPAPTGAGPDPHSLPAQVGDLPEHVLDLFTTTRLQVLLLAATGQSNRQIAHALGLSEKTIKRHIAVMISELAAHNRTHACVLAVKHGLLDTDDITATVRRPAPPVCHELAWVPIVIAARDGAPLSTVGQRTGHTRSYAGARLSEAYRTLRVDRLPRAHRREAAYQAATRAGLIQPPE